MSNPPAFAQADVSVSNHGGVFLFHLNSHQAHASVEEFVSGIGSSGAGPWWSSVDTQETSPRRSPLMAARWRCSDAGRHLCEGEHRRPTCESQLAELSAYASARKWSTIKFVDNGMSGARETRTALDPGAPAREEAKGGRGAGLVPRIGWGAVEVMEFETTDPALRGEMTITTTLVDADGGTDVIAVHDGLPPGVPTAVDEAGREPLLPSGLSSIPRSP